MEGGRKEGLPGRKPFAREIKLRNWGEGERGRWVGGRRKVFLLLLLAEFP